MRLTFGQIFNENKIQKPLSLRQQSFLTRITDLADRLISEGAKDPEIIIDTAIKNILEQEMDLIRREIERVSLTALDDIKEKVSKREQNEH